MTDHPRSPVEAAPDYIRALPPYVLPKAAPAAPAAQPLQMASNENPLGASPRAVQAMQNALQGVAVYPDPHGLELKAALQRKFGIAPERLVLGNGSSELIDLVARSFLRAGDEAVLSQYAFIAYPLAIRMVNAQAVRVDAVDYGHDLLAMLRAITPATRLVFVANPNNPTGTLLGVAALREFLAAVPGHVAVVLDEAYTEYLLPQERVDSFALVDEFPNLVVLRTFSKAYGLAGQRVGYAVAQPAMAELINRTRPVFNVNTLALCAAVAALDDDEFLERSLRTNREGMAQLREGFAGLGLAGIPSWGNFIAVDFGATPVTVSDACQQLLRAGFALRPLAPYGMGSFLRVTVGQREHNAALLDALRRILG